MRLTPPLVQTSALVHQLVLDGSLGEYIAELRMEFSARLQRMCEAIRKHIPCAKVLKPGGGYFLWVEMPEEMDTDRILEASRGHPDADGRTVRFTPGAICSPFGNLRNCLRLSFAFYDADTIEHGVALLGSLIDSEVNLGKAQ